mgnify:CR=1 FL=1
MDMINAILIEVLGSIAENERNKIRSRQREGITAAKKKNIKFGRPKVAVPDNWSRSVSLPEHLSTIIFSVDTPKFFNASICLSSFCSRLETRA